MVPIHDTDVAEERWTQAEWEHYELWEQIERRIRRRRMGWIFGISLLFLMVSAVPVIRERMPAWSAQIAARRFTEDVNEIKRRAIIENHAYQIRFESPESDQYAVERVTSCKGALPGTLDSVRVLRGLKDFPVVQVAKISRLEKFCFDPILGAEFSLAGQEMVGFAFVTAKDLAEQRLDRASALLLKGPSAEISFD